MSNVKLAKQEAINELWRRGNLKYKCKPVQKEMYDIFYSSERFSTLVWLLARQSGKTYLLAILALEAALREPNTIVKVVTDTKVHLVNIFEPKIQEVLADCPKDLLPAYDKQAQKYRFYNGSQIQLAGSDGKSYEKLRGQKSTLVLIDEAGFCKDLRDMIGSVLFPTLTHTGGKIILATTPPNDPEHEFFYYMEKADMKGLLTKKTIYDNSMVTPETLKVIIDECGGVSTEAFRREYMCEIIRSENLMVIPEFTPELEAQIVKEWVHPPYYDGYVGMDLGFNDLTIALFGYYDFRNAKLIIEDEYSINMNHKENNIKRLTEEIIKKENQLYINPITQEKQNPLIRVSDINPIVTQEINLYSFGQINFVAARKDDKDAALNNLRTMLASGKIIIHPRCTTLIRHLKNVKWRSTNNREEFARSADDGHYDAVDALKYLLRSINTTKNPYPAHFQLDPNTMHIPQNYNSNKPVTNQVEAFKKVFGIRNSKRGLYGR